MAEYQGSAYTRWNEDVRDRYIVILDYAQDLLKLIPRWEGSGLVFDSDVDDLVQLCEMFDIDIDGIIAETKSEKGRMKYLKAIMDKPESNSRKLLYDISVFKAIKGRIYKKMRDIVEKELKPTNPIQEKIEEMNAEDWQIREMEGESNAEEDT